MGMPVSIFSKKTECMSSRVEKVQLYVGDGFFLGDGFSLIWCLCIFVGVK